MMQKLLVEPSPCSWPRRFDLLPHTWVLETGPKIHECSQKNEHESPAAKINSRLIGFYPAGSRRRWPGVEPFRGGTQLRSFCSRPSEERANSFLVLTRSLGANRSHRQAGVDRRHTKGWRIEVSGAQP